MNRKSIVLITLVGVCLVVIFLLYFKKYTLALVIFFIGYIGLFIGGKLAGNKYAEKQIIDLLDNNDGQVHIDRIKHFFMQKAPKEKNKSIEKSILTIINSLEKKGIVVFENYEIIRKI